MRADMLAKGLILLGEIAFLFVYRYVLISVTGDLCNIVSVCVENIHFDTFCPGPKTIVVRTVMHTAAGRLEPTPLGKL